MSTSSINHQSRVPRTVLDSHTTPNTETSRTIHDTTIPPNNHTHNTHTNMPIYRPGRTLRHPINIDLNTSYGDSIHDRHPNSLRIFFQNVKGLTYSTTGEDYAYYFSCATSLGADIIGMAETNSAWSHYHLQHSLHTTAKKQFNQHKIAYSSPSTDIDPIPENETFQSGGTLTIATNNLVPMVSGETYHDKTGLGRWSDISFQGKQNLNLTVFTAYRVCKGNIQTSPTGSSFSREYVYHRELGIKNPQPRTLFLHDIAISIKLAQSKGNSVIVMLDSNGSLSDDTDLQFLLSTCDLIDLHAANPSPSTYIGSPHRRIDHILGCPHVSNSLTASGSLSYVEGPQSDHRGLFVDLDLTTILHQSLSSTTISTSQSRSLKTGNPESVASYTESMLQYYDDHNMEKRLDDLISAQGTMSTPTLRKHLEKWDQDQGRAMMHAESVLQRPKKPYEWSPTLRNAGLTYRYWRLRLREKTHQENYLQTLQRMETQTQLHDSTFLFPFLGIPLPISEIHKQLKHSKTELKRCQKASTSLRHQSYHDLLATYLNDNSSTRKESERRAKIVQNTIKAEQCRAMFSNIRSTVKPSATGSLNRLLAPSPCKR